MGLDVSGIWIGTLYTDGLAHMQGLEGSEGWGGPPITYQISLWISDQGNYKDYGYGQVVSFISGQIDGYDRYSVPISGFIDENGLVKLSFYLRSASVDWTLSARLTLRGIQGDISGNWTRMTWSNGWFLHQLGTLSVKKAVSRTSDSAYLGYRKLEL